MTVLVLMGGSHFGGICAHAQQTPETRERGVVSGCEMLNLRKGPSSRSDSLAQIGCGSALEVLSRESHGATTWLEVRLEDGRQGWVSARYIQIEPLQEFLQALDNINGIGGGIGKGRLSCADESDDRAEVRVTGAAQSEEDLLAADRRPGRGTFRVLKSAVKEMSGKSCFAELSRLYGSRIGNPPQEPLWAELREPERAERILAHARRTDRLLRAGKAAVRSEITPELAACVAFQETRGNMTPHRANYTFCNPEGKGKYLSTAHGLGQMTRTTLREMRQSGKLALTTVKGYENLTSDELFEALNDDVPLQMEVLFRTLEEKARIAARSPSSGNLTEDLVFRYDTDRADQYIPNVVRICAPCLKAGGKAPHECLKAMR
jgi:hypothetical protein